MSHGIYLLSSRPHLDYGDVIYDQPNNETFNQTFNQKIESVQYNTALAITGAIKGTSRERLYQELCLESMKDRRWYRRLTYFYNIVNGNNQNTLKSICHPNNILIIMNEVTYFIYLFHTEYYKNSFFLPFCVNEWKKLDPSIHNSTSVSIFKNALLKSIRPKHCPVYNIFDPTGLKFLTRLRLKFKSFEGT